MAPSAPTTQNPALSHNAPNVASQQSAQVQPGIPNTGDILANAGLSAQQLIELLRNIPAHLYNKVHITSRFQYFPAPASFHVLVYSRYYFLPTKAL